MHDAAQCSSCWSPMLKPHLQRPPCAPCPPTHLRVQLRLAHHLPHVAGAAWVGRHAALPRIFPHCQAHVARVTRHHVVVAAQLALVVPRNAAPHVQPQLVAHLRRRQGRHRRRCRCGRGRTNRVGRQQGGVNCNGARLEQLPHARKLELRAVGRGEQQRLAVLVAVGSGAGRGWCGVVWGDVAVGLEAFNHLINQAVTSTSNRAVTRASEFQ